MKSSGSSAASDVYKRQYLGNALGIAFDDGDIASFTAHELSHMGTDFASTDHDYTHECQFLPVTAGVRRYWANFVTFGPAHPKVGNDDWQGDIVRLDRNRGKPLHFKGHTNGATCGACEVAVKEAAAATNPIAMGVKTRHRHQQRRWLNRRGRGRYRYLVSTRLQLIALAPRHEGHREIVGVVGRHRQGNRRASTPQPIDQWRQVWLAIVSDKYAHTLRLERLQGEQIGDQYALGIRPFDAG